MGAARVWWSFTLVLLAMLTAATDGRREPTGDTVQAAIVGGTNAVKGRYPWMASLRIDDRSRGFAHFCGGSLIHPRIILTAAHCLIDSETGDYDEDSVVFPEVRLGGYETNGGVFERRYAVTAYVHEEYDPETKDNDIALLVLDRPSTKARVRLPLSEPDPPVKPGTIVRAIGWGDLREEGPTPRVLQEVALDFLSLSACARFEPDIDWEGNSMICAGTPSKRKDTCQGDSGGPLFVKGGTAARDLQIGVVSWGRGCATDIGIYTDLAWMRDWIDETIPYLLTPGRRSAARPRRARSPINSDRSTRPGSKYGLRQKQA